MKKQTGETEKLLVKRGCELCEVFGAEAVQERVARMAEQITADYAGKDLVMVCVLKGAFMFFADLVRRIPLDMETDFVRIKSYGSGSAPSSGVLLTKDVECSLEGRDVLVVEDIVDCGLSMDFLLRTFRARGPKSLRLAALIDKKERRCVEVNADYAGFVVDEGFLVGYGLDYAEHYRAAPAIFRLNPEH
ncbi:MAG: hypoxanthine phosphoribosyltransferase [Desulfovibrio sp.]|jgi:hypoxanthine phosphoribosyltransferase|nr:hypoxanthine phosphoribosyltransferase [Desulfovibrio sp.]